MFEKIEAYLANQKKTVNNSSEFCGDSKHLQLLTISISTRLLLLVLINIFK